MSSKRYQITYPNRSRLSFDGGLNNKYERALIQDNESADCLNVIYDDGAVETRGGSDRFNSSSVGSFVCDGLYTRHDYVANSQTMVAWFNGSLYYGGVSTFVTIPSAQSIYTAGQRVYADEYENYMFFGNGNNTPYKYNGTFTRHGIPAPTSTLSVATAATGSALTGAYIYGYTYVNSGIVEGDISPLTATFTAAGENVAITGIPTAPVSFGVNNINLYRTVSSGSTMLRLTTVSNGTTSYDDAVPDTSLGAEAPSDNGEPPDYSDILYHQARLFVIDPADNLIKYSDIGNPYVFGALSFLRVGDNTFDVPVSLDRYDNSIIVNCRINAWMIYMPSTDPADWVVVNTRGAFGSRSPFSGFHFNNMLMYGAVQNDKFVGFSAISGQTITPSATLLTSSAVGSELQSDRIEPDMFDIQEGYLQNISSIVYQNKAYIAATKGDGQTSNNRIYVFDFSLGQLGSKNPYSWVPWSGINVNDFTIFNGVLYGGTSLADGMVYKLNTTTYNDDGTAINSYSWTKEYSGQPGHENYEKDFRYAQLFYEQSGDWDMSFFYRVNSDSGDGNFQQIDLNPGGSLWGTMVWGRDLWGGGDDQTEKRLYLSPARGKRIQFKFSNQNEVGQKFKVLGLNFVYNLKGLR